MEELIGGADLLRVPSLSCEAGWQTSLYGTVQADWARKSLHETLQGDLAAVQTVSSWCARMCGVVCRASCPWSSGSSNPHLLDMSTAAPPMRNKQLVMSIFFSLPRYMQAVTFSWLMTSARLLGRACMHAHRLTMQAWHLWRGVQGRSWGWCATTAAVRAIQAGQLQRHFKSASCRPLSILR